MIFPLLCCFHTLTPKRPKGRLVTLMFICPCSALRAESVISKKGIYAPVLPKVTTKGLIFNQFSFFDLSEKQETRNSRDKILKPFCTNSG